MPVYSVTLNIPTTATELNPVETTLKVVGDYITHVEVIFPAGNNWVSRVAIFYGIQKLYPFLPDEWFFGTDETIEFDTLDPLPDMETRLRIVGWNNGGKYDHVVAFRIVTAYEWQIRERVVYEELLKRLDLLLRRIGII
jgi:hypothetical protein